MKTATLHLLGVLVGAILGVLFLKLKWVDCEGWDLFSVMAGNHASAKATRKRVANSAPKENAIDEQTERERLQKRKQEVTQQIQQLLAEGHPRPAFALYQKMTARLGDLGLSAAQLLQLGKSLLAANQISECITAWLAYLKLEQEPAIKLRLKLAQLLMEARRPATALEVLAGIPSSPLPTQFEDIRRQLTVQVNAQFEDAELELE